MTFIIILYQRSSGDGILSMRLFHFENPQSRLPDGSCCDGSKGSTGLCYPCGYYFKICLANMGSKDCTLFNITTQVLTNYEYYLFQSSFYTHPASKNIKNPIKIALDGWKVSILNSIIDKTLYQGVEKASVVHISGTEQ